MKKLQNKNILLICITVLATIILTAYNKNENLPASDLDNTDINVSVSFTDAPAHETPIPVVNEVIAFSTDEPSKTAIPTPEPTPSPEPTPTPLPTEIPFSYYAPTVNMSFEELVGSLGDLDTVHPFDKSKYLLPKYYPAPDTYKIIVDTYWQVVKVYTKDENGDYTIPVRYMLCSSGSSRVGSETRLGEWKMQPVKLRFGKFVGTGEFAQYWSLIRSRTYFHSILYTTSDLSTYQVSVYNNLGKKASHACVRLTVPDARWIYYNICYDTVCNVIEGSKDDLETKAIREQLILAQPPVTRVKIIAGETPYTDNWSIDEIAGDINYPYVDATQPPVK